jgi:hypothetical protein
MGDCVMFTSVKVWISDKLYGLLRVLQVKCACDYLPGLVKSCLQPKVASNKKVSALSTKT